MKISIQLPKTAIPILGDTIGKDSEKDTISEYTKIGNADFIIDINSSTLKFIKNRYGSRDYTICLKCGKSFKKKHTCKYWEK